MKKIRHFKCDDDHITEKFAEDDERVTRCDCGKDARRMLSTPRFFGNTTGKSPARHK